MRCLYIVSHDPISPNYGSGASVIYYEQLATLAELGHDIHLWHYAYPAGRAEFHRFIATDDAIWAEIKAICKSVTLTTLPAQAPLWDRISNKAARWLLRRDHLHQTAAYRILEQLVQSLQPDFIWAQHLEPARLASLVPRIPIIYSHLDWLYRIKALRAGREEDPHKKRIEEKLARKVAAVVSGSAIECDELRTLGCRRAFHIPVAYPPAALSSDLTALTKPRLVHIGSLQATANRLGLERFFEIVWPRLSNLALEFWVIGDTTGASPRLKELLRGAICTGFIGDLGAVLRPFDLNVIPWEHSTGQRTRMAMAFNHSQVVVAVRAAVAGFPEALDGENCRLVNSLEQVAGVVAELVDDPEQRERLGHAARHTFESSFTRQALLPRYQAVISSIG